MVDWEEFYRSFRRTGFLPGYEIQNHLGGGAFGEVYKARKTSIGKAYAIKFLRLDAGATREAVERELEQVRLFASIDHPNLVTIEDMGVAGGVPYLIMGYAGEETLALRLARRDLDPESGLRYFVQACRGVLALHDRRLAHFDLKPGNVFLKGDVARVGDYGLAKLLTEGRQTLSFGRGTPHYMAPEMLKNRADHRADVYSLGVILYESLAFRLPFGSPEGAIAVREDDAPPPFTPGFPVAVRPVVERCLRLDPRDRYASVHELLDALGQTARQGESIRLDLAGVAAATGEAGLEAGLASRSGAELRQAAAELARGAVGVARGMWDGVVERVAPADERGEGFHGDDVVSVSGLDEARESSHVPSSPPHGAARASAVGPQGGTVPVPPRVEGLAGTVFATVVLGAEILGVLVSGPVLLVLRSFARLVDRAARGVHGLLGRLVRLSLFLLLLALLGGAFAFALLFLISLDL